MKQYSNHLIMRQPEFLKACKSFESRIIDLRDPVVREIDGEKCRREGFKEGLWHARQVVVTRVQDTDERRWRATLVIRTCRCKWLEVKQIWKLKQCSQTFVPMWPEIYGRCWQVVSVQRWLIVVITEIGAFKLMVAVGRWSLFWPPLGPKICGCCWQVVVVERWSVFRGSSLWW